MKVSIITATYNSSDTIKDTLKSVKQQSHSDIEHVIIDGASTDDTLLQVTSFGHNDLVISEKDNGIYDAMNKGIKAASGDIIGILNSDDFYKDDSIIEKVVRIFEETGCDAVYGDLQIVHRQNVKMVVRKWVAGTYKPNDFYNGWMPPHPTVFVKKDVYEKYGGFNERFQSSSDYELLLRLMFVQKIKAEYLPEVMVKMRAGGQSNSSIRNRIAAHLEDYKAWQHNGISPKWYTLSMKPIRKVEQYRYAIMTRLAFPSFNIPSFGLTDLLHSALIPNQRVIISYALLLTSLISMTPFRN
ncbi:MAG TPA: glycosyltransferase family 2 protein [Segetibacter sp.]|jgi:glycosyltransferase